MYNAYQGFLNKDFVQLLDDMYIDPDDYDMICFLLGDAQ